MFIVSTKTSHQIHLEDNKSESKNKFKRFWKQLCPFGEWVDPNDWENSKLVIDDNLVDQMIKNFEEKTIDYVPVPLGHPFDSSALADLNTGELLELEKREDGLYGLLEIRDEEVADKIERSLIPNVSMGFDLRYKDKKTGEIKGAVLQHIGLVVDPYLKGMKAFEPALSDNASDATVLLSENNPRKEDKMFIKVQNDRDFDVEVKYKDGEEERVAILKSGEEIEVPADQEEIVKNQIANAENQENKKDAAEKISDIENREKALSEERAKLDQEKAEIEKAKTELSEKQSLAEYEKLLSEGKILPSQKDTFLALSSVKNTEVRLSDTETKSVKTLLSELFGNMPDMRLLSEDGDGSSSDGVSLSEADKANIERYNLNPEDYKATKQELEKGDN